MIRKITIFIATTLMLINFSGCSNDAGFDEARTLVDVCECSKDGVFRAEAFTALQSSDMLVKEETPTRVKTYLDSDGVKKVCVSSGKASILRVDIQN